MDSPNDFLSAFLSAYQAVVNRNPQDGVVVFPTNGGFVGLNPTVTSAHSSASLTRPLDSSAGMTATSAAPAATVVTMASVPLSASRPVNSLRLADSPVDARDGYLQGQPDEIPCCSASTTSSNGILRGGRQEIVSPRIRTLFQPYSHDRARNAVSQGMNGQVVSTDDLRSPVNLVQNLRGSQANRRHGSVVTRSVQIRSWIIPVVFLGDPTEDKYPDSSRFLELAKAKLGKKPVTCNLQGPQSMLQAAMATFLHETGDQYLAVVSSAGFAFELHHIEGSGNKTLIPLTAGYHPIQIKALRYNTLYARPNMVLLPLLDPYNEADDEESSGSSSEFYEVVGRRPRSSVPPNDNNVLRQENQPETVDGTVAGSVLTEQDTLRGEAAAAEVPHEPAGFRPNVTSFTDIHGLRRFIFLTSGPQSVEVSQLGPELYPLTELSRFIHEINPERRTIVRIRDESTIDDGGPLLAFIWKLTKSIQCGEYNGLSLLYGKEPNATLSADRCLIRDNVMSMLARFTAFSILNTGKGLYGLNRICVKVLTSTWWPTAADIKISDIPDPDAKFAAESLQSILDDGEVDWRHKVNARTYLLAHEWGYEITLDTAPVALDFVKIHATVGYREASLHQFREAFLATDVGRWVSCHENMLDDIFPPKYPTELTADDLMGMIDGPNEYPQVLSMLRNFLGKYEAEGKKISSFVEAVTGYPYLLDNDRITVVVDSPGRLFNCSTCFKELRVTICDPKTFDENMDLFLQDASRGFSNY